MLYLKGHLTITKHHLTPTRMVLVSIRVYEEQIGKVNLEINYTQ
jgi:hypothetical protein